MNRLAAFGTLSLSACVFGGSSTHDGFDAALTASASPVTACAAADTSVSVTLNASEVTLAWVDANGAETPATLNGSSVSVPASLAAGDYGLVVRRGSDEVSVANVLTLVASPVVTSAAATVCRKAGMAEQLVLTGSHLAGTSVKVGTVAVDVLPSSDGNSATVTLNDQIAVGGPYAITVTGGNNCVAQVADAVRVVAAPSAFVIDNVSPRLSDVDNALSVANAVRVRLLVDETTDVLSGAQEIWLNDVKATDVHATPAAGGSLDVTFAALTLMPKAAGSSIELRAGSCVQSAAFGSPLKAAEPGFGFFGTNPTHMTATDGFILDVRGTFPVTPDEVLLPANAAKYALSVDVNPDPFIDEWQPMRLLYGMGRGFDAPDAQALRVVFAPSGTVVAITESYAAHIRVTRTDTSRSVVFENAVTMQPNGDVPRVALKSVDWIDADRAGQHFEIYGCYLDEATFSLVAADGTATSLTASNVTSNDDFAQGNFDCSTSEPATGRATLTVPAVAAGIYHLQVSGPSGAVHEDSYPLVAYSASASLGTFTDVATLSTARRNPQSVVAYDRYGRKYVYVIGGDETADKINPLELDNNFITTYELAPVARDHTLASFAAPHAASGLTYAYGEALVADGTNVYGLGGTTGGSNAQALIARAKVSDPLTSTSEHFGTLTPFTNASTLSAPRYGLKSELVVDGVNRKLVTVGGGAISDGFPTNVVDITVLNPLTGSVSSSAAGPSLPAAGTGNQAAQSLITARGFSSDELWSFGGIHSQNGTTTAPSGANPGTGPVSLIQGYFSWSSPTGISATPDFTGTASTTEFGYAMVQVGRQLLLLGGGHYQNSSGHLYDPDVDDEIASLPIADLALGTRSTLPGKLPRRQALFGNAHLPPHLFTLSGVQCNPSIDGSEVCGEADVELNPHVSASTLSP